MSATLVNPGYTRAIAIAKSDTVNFDGSTDATNPATAIVAADAIWVGGAGIVVLVLADHSLVNFTCVAGQLLPVRAIRVNSTNTTATLMVALYEN